MPAHKILHPQPRRILVIKLGALGDFVQALGPIRAIRHHHPQAHITLLTRPPFTALGKACNYFDDVMIDPSPRSVRAWCQWRTQLRAGGFARVYDLQNNDRTALYLRLMAGRQRPDWIGATPGATIRNNSTSGHAFDRHVQTLALAGITNVSLDDLSWMTGTDHDFGIQPPYVLLVPGSAPQRPEKRWPHYAALATQIAAHGFQPVILGSADESALAEQIIAAAPTALNLCGRTQLTDIPALARHAAAAVGNDTGPMHMIAPTGCPALVLFSAHSDPQRHAPRGAHVETLQSPHLQDLTVTQVFKKMEMLSR